ncbi:MAG: hypothetical protein AB7L09_21985 [Nitrospira sp.]
MTPVELRDTEWAYLAGFIDGDGCISANTRAGWSNYYPRVSISQVEGDYLAQLKQWFGGALRQRIPSGVGSRMIWNLQIPSGGTRVVLNGVLPYLRYKQPQAEIALKITGHPQAKELYWELRRLKKAA